MVKDLDAVMAEIDAADPSAAGPIWGRAHKLLLKSKTDKGYSAQVVMARDVEALRDVIEQLRAGGAPTGPSVAPVEDAAPEIDDDTLNRAFKAFRRRMELMRLDDESRLSVSPLTGGKKSGVFAMQPPRDYPKEVWDALVKQGRLRYAGEGYYELR